MARIVVIGAGMAGLASAVRLKVKGHSVTVIEQSETYGGKLGVLARDGFVFDTGPSLFTLPAVYRHLFNITGQPLEESVDIVPLDTAFGYRFADGSRIEMPGVDPARCAAAIGDGLGGQAGDDWLRLMARASEVWRITRRPFLESPLTGVGDLISLARNRHDIRTVAPFSSLRKIGAQYLSDPRARILLDRYATYTGSDPRRAPAALVTVPYVEQEFGAWHLKGGLRTLGTALEQRCHDRGVEFRYGTDVQEVLLRDGRVAGVDTSHGVVESDLVVANADATHLYRDLVHDPRATRALKKLRKATPSLSGFVMLIAARGTTPGIRHHNVWFPSNYDAEFDAIFGRDARPVDDPTIYACVPNDDAMRPNADSESWFILINAPRQGEGRGCYDWTAPGRREAYADHVLSVLAQRGVDLRERMLWREIRTPADLAHDTRAPGGSIYGSSSNGARAAFLRPTNASPIPGLYLAGGSAHPGGGLPLVGMSSDIVSTLIGSAESR
jgi:phytoene desaturase